LGILFLQAIYLALALFVPIALLITFGVLWFVPRSRHARLGQKELIPSPHSPAYIPHNSLLKRVRTRRVEEDGKGAGRGRGRE
jgi:hypothetical protein